MNCTFREFDLFIVVTYIFQCLFKHDAPKISQNRLYFDTVVSEIIYFACVTSNSNTNSLQSTLYVQNMIHIYCVCNLLFCHFKRLLFPVIYGEWNLRCQSISLVCFSPFNLVQDLFVRVI